jgi:hypothetical protein
VAVLGLAVALLAIVLVAVARRSRRTAPASGLIVRPATDPLPPRAPAPPAWPDSPWFLPRDDDPPGGDATSQPGQRRPGDPAADPSWDRPSDPPLDPQSDRPLDPPADPPAGR